VSGNFFKHHR